MKIKILNLNIYGGKLYKNIITFIKDHDFDILCLQEVKGGSFGFTNSDILNDLKNDLGLDAEFAFTTNLEGDKNSYDGNAIFYKKSFKVSNKQILNLYPYHEVTKELKIFNNYPRNAISLDFNLNGKVLTIVNTQLAWNQTPNETPIQTEVGNKLLEFTKKINNEFLLMGDFNLEADSNLVKNFNSFLRNLTLEKNITNTLNGNIHRAKDIFPKGLAVDFIFTTFNIQVDEFKLIDNPDLSDHFGLSVTVDF